MHLFQMHLTRGQYKRFGRLVSGRIAYSPSNGITSDVPQKPSPDTPLSPQVFQILLALADGPLHGYAIIQDVQQRTDGEIQLTPSTLYDALARLVDQQWIEETASNGPRRRTYALTSRGREAMSREAQRLTRLIAAAREKKVIV